MFSLCFYCCRFLFFGRPNVLMKKRKLICEQKIQTTFSGQLQTVFALCAFQMRAFLFQPIKALYFNTFSASIHHLAMTKCINNKVGRGHLFGGRFAWSQINVLRIVLFLFLCQEKICSRSPDKNKSTYN